MARVAGGDAEELAVDARGRRPGRSSAGAWQRGLTPYLPTRIAAVPVPRGQNGYARSG